MSQAQELLQLFDSHALELARLASVASRVEPELLRALRLRLLPSADVSAEGDVWWSRMVTARSATSIRFDAADLTNLRESLSTRTLDAAFRIVRQIHRRAPLPTRYEELITWLALRGRKVAAEKLLQRVADAMAADPAQALSLAGWALDVLPRLPVTLQNTSAFVGLLFLSNAQGRGRAAIQLDPAAVAAAWDKLPNVFADRDKVEVIASRRGKMLFFALGQPKPTTGLAIPDMDPLFVEVTTDDTQRVARVPRIGVEGLEVGNGDVSVRSMDGMIYALRPVTASQPTLPKPTDVLARLQETSVFINGPGGAGSGYLIARQRIGTAAHVVKGWQEGQAYEVTVGVNGKVCLARLLKVDLQTDSAVLAFDEELAVAPLPIAETLVRGVAWEGYGFPAVAQKTGTAPPGLPLDGDVKDAATSNDLGQPAILLYSAQIAAGAASPLHGFSGGPIVVEGALVGHFTKHIGDDDDRRRPASFGYVYACPIDAVVKLLDVPLQKVVIAPPRLETLGDVIPPLPDGDYHVFVSYRSTDRAWAMSLVERLDGAGLRVFIDQRELEFGEQLGGQLEVALKRSRSAVVLVSKGWLESPWCQAEGQVLTKRAVEDKSFKLVPLRLDESEMPPFLDTRLWVDFKGTARAEGDKLQRLVDTLVRRVAGPIADSPTARAAAAEAQVVDKFVREIYREKTNDEKRILALVANWRKLASPDVAPLIAAAEVLNGKGAFEQALKVLEGATEPLRVRQLRAFATSKMGNIAEAISQLEALRDEGALDPETAGLLAGRYKRLWLKQGDRAQLLAAYQLYSETYQRTGDPFNGINAAALALQCDDLAKMYQFAGGVREKLLKRPEGELSSWDLATLGEAFLLEKRFDDAFDWYSKAAGKAAGLHQDIAVMRWQARLNLLKMNADQEARLNKALPVPRVLAYFGHMVDADDRATSRFQKDKVGAVRLAIRQRLEAYGALHGFGQAARGSDLIFLQELLKRNLTATVVLPFPKQDFVETSVTDDWRERFEEVFSNPLVTVRDPLQSSRPSATELPQAFAKANRQVQKLTLEYAERLDEKAIAVAVWDGKAGDGPGGTADAVRLWQDEGYAVDVIDITKL